MSNKGFRRSLMGFNRDDVLQYISNEDKKNTKKINSLNAEIVDLKNKISSLNSQLEIYKDKEEEINRLADSIGALYIIAKNNAEIILENAKQSKSAASEEINKNLEILNSAQESYEDIKQTVLRLTNAFSQSVDNAITSLKDTENIIEEKMNKADEVEKIFESTLK